MNHRILGMDIGSTAVKIVIIDHSGTAEFTWYALHHGKPQETLRRGLQTVPRALHVGIAQIGATGSGSRRLQEGQVSSYSELSCQSTWAATRYPQVNTLLEMGGQEAKLLRFTDEGVRIDMSSDCSAGTGSFLEHQAQRLDLELECYQEALKHYARIPRIAGRCSVFAKTDIIHLQQEGASIHDILVGLCYAVARTFKGSVIKKHEVRTPVAFVGGVARNRAMVQALTEVLKLDEPLLVPDECALTGAYGAALQAASDAGAAMGFETLINVLEQLEQRNAAIRTSGWPPLSWQDSAGAGAATLPTGAALETLRASGVYLGIDVGSTSTNVALLSHEGVLLDFRYLPTAGRPLEVVRAGLLELEQSVGTAAVLGVGVTGSGRYLTGEFVGADLVRDEITAQARAAKAYDPSADTVIEIGGQDSKFIRLQHGAVIDFEMNKVCAAGTGSFLEEQARKLEVPVEQMGALALTSSRPEHLGERCTVFMESSLSTRLLQGALLNDLVAGLCYGVAANYLNRVAGGKQVGERIVFQGGVAHNTGVVAALRQLTGKAVTAVPHAGITGCIGAALLVMDAGIRQSHFIGFPALPERPLASPKAAAVSSPEHPAQAGSPANAASPAEPELFALRTQRYLAGYAPARVPGHKTIGIPRVLFIHKMFPMFRTLFSHLGYTVILSRATDETIVKASQEYSFEEACFPVKLINGHVADLLEQGVDYVFLPNVVTMKHPVSRTRQDYPCAFMQQAALTVKLAMNLEQRGVELLNPTLSFKFGKLYMMKTFVKLGLKLGSSPPNTIRGVKKAFQVFTAFDSGLEAMGREYLSKISASEKVFVLMTRPYGVMDPVLNMQIPRKLHQMGCRVIPMDVLPVHHYDINDDYPNMYWPFGQHVLAAAQIIRNTPNLYAVYLTNHGCGPDTIISHFVQQEMQGKPYLHIEVDEHSSGVGIQTRLEAFLNSLDSANQQSTPPQRLSSATSTRLKPASEEAATLLLPNWGSYSRIAAQYLGQQGYRVEVLPQTTATSLSRGRQFSISKEYFTMVALLGDVFTYLERHPDSATAFVVPATEGAEAHGLYGQLLQRELLQAGQTQAVLTPFLEDMLGSGSSWGGDSRGIFERLLAVDWLEYLLSRCGGHTAADIEALELYHHALDTLEVWFRDTDKANNLASVMALYAQPENISIGLVGEPWALCNRGLMAEVEERLHRLGATLYRPAVSELLLTHLLIKRQESAAKKEGRRYLTLTGHYRAAAALYRNYGKRVAGSHRCFIQPEQIVRNADPGLKYFFAGLAQHRTGKPKLMRQQGMNAVMHFSGMYENTGIITSLLSGASARAAGLPWLNFSYDGRLTQKDELMLEAFVSSIRPTLSPRP